MSEAADYAAAVAQKCDQELCNDPASLAQTVLLAALGEAVTTLQTLSRENDMSELQRWMIASDTARRCEVILGRYGLPRTDGNTGIRVPSLDPFL